MSERPTPAAGGPEAQPYPRFSDSEMARRRAALAAVMAERGVQHVLLYGADRAGSAIPWLTRWPVTREALVVHTPDEQDLLLVNFYNHVPNARRLATEARVEWAGRAPVETALAELHRRGRRSGAVGVMGPLPWRAGAALTAAVGEVVDLGGAYADLRLVKSEEEIAWLRVGCELTDHAVAALAAAAAPGVDERELGNAIERAYVGHGGTTHIHYLAATPMDDPRVSVPAQWPSTRALRRGDALTCEISASYWDHPGQVLRTFAIAEDPPPLYRRLHGVAEEAFDALLARLRPGTTAAELVEASSLIGEAGFTTRDDLVHGFVGGYLPPILGDASRILEPVPDFTFEPGMTVVIQPNVVTPDERAGVQTGELVLVTAQGAERLHSVPAGLRIAAATSSTASTIAS